MQSILVFSHMIAMEMSYVLFVNSSVHQLTHCILQLESCQSHFGTCVLLVVSLLHGHFFDEVIPSTKELKVDDEGISLLSQNCKYLFFTLCKFTKCDPHGVSFNNWVQFWFKGPSKYTPPPSRQHRKRNSVKPRTIQNPHASLMIHVWQLLKEKTNCLLFSTSQKLQEERHT